MGETPGEQPVDLGEIDAVPSAGTTDYSRYESAPDGLLIPIPSEVPEGNPIRDDAQITVGPRQSSGYYVAIYNGPPDAEGHNAELLAELLTEASITQLEHMLAEAAVQAATKVVIKFAGLAVGVIISLLTPSPILRETFVGTKLEDGTRCAMSSWTRSTEGAVPHDALLAPR